MQPNTLARKHIALERMISHPDAHGIRQEAALGLSHGHLHFQDSFHVLNLLKLKHYH